MNRKYKATLVCAAASWCLSSAAYAQTSASNDLALEEIVVTANKREQGLSKVPLSISAFSKEEMDIQGVRSVGDVALLTPGLSFSRDSFGGATNTNISIRGISSTAGAATTGIYIDDIPIQVRANIQTSFGTAFPQVFDLERVEVLRGPQGTLYGAGSQGGTVRFITPAPNPNEFSAYARGEASTTTHGGEGYEAGLAVNVPLVQDKLGLRVSGWHQRVGGYVDRVPTNLAEPSDERFKNTNSGETTSFRAAMSFEPSASIRIMPSVYYQKQTSQDSGSIWNILSDFDQHDFANGSSISQPTQDKFALYGLEAEIDFDAFSLTSVTSYFDRTGSSSPDYTMLNTYFIFGVNPPVPFVPGQIAPGTTDVKQKNFSQELRLSSLDDGPVQWTVGAFYSHNQQDGSVKVEDQFVGQIIPIPLEAIFGIGLTDDQYIFTSGNNSTEEQWALFGQADVKFDERLSLTLGLRYSSTQFVYTRTLGGPLNYPGFGPDIHATTGDQKSHPFTPKVGLNFQIDNENLVYATVAKGFRVGGVNPPLFIDPQTGDSCSSIPVPDSFGPDSLWSYEAGSKNRFLGGKVRTEASLYYIKWNDIQQFVNPGGCAGNGFRDNLGSATSKGFEFLSSVQVVEGLRITGTVGYVKATFDDTFTSPAGTIVTKGDSLPTTPWQLSGVLDYSRPVGGAEGYLHLAHQYGSHNTGRNSRHDPDNISYDPDLKFDPSVSQTNIRVGWRKNDLDISLYANNLFDNAPRLSKDHDSNGSLLYYYRTLRPRTIGLTLTWRR